jgi:hypothetical protein
MLFLHLHFGNILLYVDEHEEHVYAEDQGGEQADDHLLEDSIPAME